MIWGYPYFRKPPYILSLSGWIMLNYNSFTHLKIAQTCGHFGDDSPYYPSFQWRHSKVISIYPDFCLVPGLTDCIIFSVCWHMTGWWFQPLWKIWKSVGMISPSWVDALTWKYRPWKKSLGYRIIISSSLGITLWLFTLAMEKGPPKDDLWYFMMMNLAIKWWFPISLRQTTRG